MKLQRIRKLHRFFHDTEGLFGANAVLAAGLGLPFVIIASGTLKNAAAISLSTYCAIVPSVIVGALIAKKASEWIKWMIIPCVALLGAYLSRFIIRELSPAIFDSLGMYLPLLAVNSMIFNRSIGPNADRPLYRALASGILYCGGFALVTLTVAAIREFLGSGSLWGVALSPYKFPAALTVFSGFILLGFLMAGARGAHRFFNFVNYRLDNPSPATLKRQEAERMVD